MRVLKGIAASAAAGAIALGSAGTALAQEAPAEGSVKIAVTPSESPGFVKRGELANLVIKGCTEEGTVSSSVFVEEEQIRFPEPGKPSYVIAEIRKDAPLGEATVTATCGDTGTQTFEVLKANSAGPPEIVLQNTTIVGERQIRFGVLNCLPGPVSVSSPVKASASVDRTETSPKYAEITMTLKKDTKLGSYPVTVECKGQPPATHKLQVTEAMLKDRGGNGDDNDGKQDDGQDGGDKGGDKGGQDDSPKPTQPKLSFLITDGFFTSADRGVALKVLNCQSNEVSATSPAFSSTSYDPKTHVINAQVKEGIDNGAYKLKITCKGQQSLTTKITINESPMDDTGNGGDTGNGTTGDGDDSADGNDQTTYIPDGAAQTGGGATATTTAASGARL